MRKIIHLIPYDGIGGVEAAARTMLRVREGDLDFEVRWLFPTVSAREGRGATFNPLRIVSQALDLARRPPDLLIVSLWRCAIVGVLARALNPRLKLALFVHNSQDAHRLDRLFTRLAARMSTAILTDSAASVAKRFDRPPAAPVHVISYLSAHHAPLPEGPPAPLFAFWGRLSAQKNVGRALDLFARVSAARPDARFLVIGPDGGEAQMLKDRAAALGLGDSVAFAGPLPFDAIPPRLAAFGVRFLLQTSRYEGMAMSVAEAMQMGLVPVVTPVGEIASYCTDGGNAVIVADPDGDSAAADAVLALLDDPDRYAALREAAIATWRGKPLYRDSVLAAVRDALA